MPSGTSKRSYRQTSQEVCPWNVSFSKELPDASPCQPREVVGSKDARQIARELLGMSQEEFSRAFKGSPMKRAKLRGLKRNAAVLLSVDQSFGTGTSLTGVIVLVQRVKPGHRNLWTALTSSASTMKNNVCCAFAPYRPISFTPFTSGLYNEFEPPSSRGQVSGVWTCVI